MCFIIIIIIKTIRIISHCTIAWRYAQAYPEKIILQLDSMGGCQHIAEANSTTIIGISEAFRIVGISTGYKSGS